jgi:hypothetical protein
MTETRPIDERSSLPFNLELKGQRRHRHHNL